MEKMIIRTKRDAELVLEGLMAEEVMLVYPNGRYGNLQVGFSVNGCREFWNGEEGTVGENAKQENIDTLWKYRAAYNKGDMTMR